MTTSLPSTEVPVTPETPTTALADAATQALVVAKQVAEMKAAPLPSFFDHDPRDLAEVQFAINLPEEEREAAAERVREIFRTCGAKTAQDAIELGCTGLAKHGVDIETAKFVRENMAGARFSLTCYVPDTKHCLVHEGIGGLLNKNRANVQQEMRHPEVLDKISRELTPQETVHLSMMESTMRKELRESEARRALTGKESVDFRLPEGWEVDGQPVESRAAAPVAQFQLPQLTPQRPEDFKCPEHGETLWSCRFCVASEVIRGDWSPALLLAAGTENEVDPESVERIEGVQVPLKVQELDKKGVDRVVLLARVATWTRKLAR